MSSSDGWPDSGPIESVRRAPLTSRAEHEGQQQQRDPGRRPRVLVGPQPGVRADGEREAPRSPPSATSSQPSWSWPRPSSAPPNDWVDEVLGQPLHQQQPDAAEHAPTAGSSTWSVRRPASTNARWTTNRATEVDEQALRVGRQRGRAPPAPRRPRAARWSCWVGPERRAARRRSVDGDDREQGELGRRGPRVERGSRRAGRAWASGAHSRPRSRRNRTSPTWSSSPNPSGRDALDRARR